MIREAIKKAGELMSERNTFANLVETQAVTIRLRYDPSNLESLGQEALEKVGAFVKTGRQAR